MMRTSVTAKLLEVNVARGEDDKAKTTIKVEIDNPSFFDIIRDFQSRAYDFINKISAEVMFNKNKFQYVHLTSLGVKLDWADKTANKPKGGVVLAEFSYDTNALDLFNFPIKFDMYFDFMERELSEEWERS